MNTARYLGLIALAIMMTFALMIASCTLASAKGSRAYHYHAHTNHAPRKHR